jgi:hypothetical protein
MVLRRALRDDVARAATAACLPMVPDASADEGRHAVAPRHAVAHQLPTAFFGLTTQVLFLGITWRYA